jgi:hypothetical protein
LQKFRVVFTFEARDEREAIQLISCPDIMKREAEMRVENVTVRMTLAHALMLSPLIVALLLIGYGLAEAAWNW